MGHSDVRYAAKAEVLAEVYPQFAAKAFGIVIPGRPEGPSPESITPV
jgi:hypothetical protein